MSILNHFIPNKISKFDYQKPVCMNNEVICLKKRSKPAKKYYNNTKDHNKDVLVNTATDCSILIIAAKEKKHTQFIAQLQDINTSPKPNGLFQIDSPIDYFKPILNQQKYIIHSCHCQSCCKCL